VIDSFFARKYPVKRDYWTGRYGYHEECAMVRYPVSALQGACISGEIEKVRTIIESTRGKDDARYDNPPHDAIRAAYKSGDREIIALVEERYGTNWEEAICGAYRSGHYADLVDDKIVDRFNVLDRLSYQVGKRGDSYVVLDLSTHGHISWNFLAQGAAMRGHVHLINIALPKLTITDMTACLDKACVGGHLEIVRLLIDAGCEWPRPDWTNICYSGNIDIIITLHKHGIWDANKCLTHGAYCGQDSVVSYALANGATDLAYGLAFAAESGCLNITKRLVVLGASGYSEALSTALGEGNRDVAAYMATQYARAVESGRLDLL
jgi:hypothetical protein